jgi:hypothetical protein
MGYYIPKEPGRSTRRGGHLMRGFVPKPIKGCQSLVFMGMGRLYPVYVHICCQVCKQVYRLHLNSVHSRHTLEYPKWKP